MLRIQETVLRLVRELVPVLEAVSRHDPDLGRQMRRALTSVPLNVAEGASSRGRSRGLRYQTAAGSIREVGACIDVAHALGYVPAPAAVVSGDIALVVNTLMKVARS